MDDLETKLRERLIEEDSKEFCVLFKTPKYRNAMKNLVKKSFKDSVELKMKTEELDKAVNAFYQDDDNMKKMAHETAKETYATREETQKELDESYVRVENIAKTLIENDDLKRKFMIEYIRLNRRMIDGSSKFEQKNFEYFLALKKVAEQKGLDYAVSKKVRCAVTRKLFPTVEDYLINKNKRIEIEKQYLKDFEKLCTEYLSSESHVVMSSFICAFGEIGSKLEKQKILKDAKKIYGKK